MVVRRVLYVQLVAEKSLELEQIPLWRKAGWLQFYPVIARCGLCREYMLESLDMMSVPNSNI